MKCQFCNTATMLKYSQLKDYYFNTDEVSDYWECENCKIIQTPYDLDKLNLAYKGYYTNTSDITKSRPDTLRRILFLLVQRLNKRIKLDIIEKRRPFIFAPKCSIKSGAKVLDFGYGSGTKLTFLNNFFEQCHGYDLYPNNVSFLSEQGIIIHSTMETIPDNLDYIILDNVIEHVDDPKNLIEQLYKKLAPSGSLVLITPNNESILHHTYKKYWRGLESPRHINIFSKRYFLQNYQTKKVKVYNNWKADKYVIGQAQSIGITLSFLQKLMYYGLRILGKDSSEMIVKLSK